MWKLLDFATSLIGGSSVQIYLYVALAVGGFGAGFYVEHLRFANYKTEVEAVAKAQEAHVQAVQEQHKLVTKGIQDEYDAKLGLIRQYYANGVRQSSGSPVSGISTTSAISNATTAYNQLAEQCSQTTLMLVELQKWVNEQMGIN
jgi:hypothetical protein